jgi:putative ABC transport system permease protein
VLREGALVIGIGVAAGLAGAWALRTALQAQLYEVDAMEPRVLLAVVAMLTVTALVACTVPARRAASTDPAQALADR